MSTVPRTLQKTDWRHSQFFLIAPELAHLADQAKEMAGTSSRTQDRHHNLAASVSQREDKSIDQVLTTMPNFMNPFKKEGDEQFNLVTKSSYA